MESINVVVDDISLKTTTKELEILKSSNKQDVP